MKSTFAITLFLAAVVQLAAASSAVGQKADSGAIPKYDAASESTFKGTVIDVIDRKCPMSGGLGTHLNLKLEDGKTIEVHLAATKFLKDLDFVFNKGDKVEVVGVKVQFENKETIFARLVTRGSETFAFRNPNGEPVW
jgi:DNA/RNA endonuclease YhcR with UshA esterase domain